MLEIYGLFCLALQLSSVEQLSCADSSGRKKGNILVNQVLRLVKMTLAILTLFHCEFFFHLYSWCMSICSKENSLFADEEPDTVTLQLYPRICKIQMFCSYGSLVPLITSSKLEYWTKFFYITREGLLYHNDLLWVKSKNDAIYLSWPYVWSQSLIFLITLAFLITEAWYVFLLLIQFS